MAKNNNIGDNLHRFSNHESAHLSPYILLWYLIYTASDVDSIATYWSSMTVVSWVHGDIWWKIEYVHLGEKHQLDVCQDSQSARSSELSLSMTSQFTSWLPCNTLRPKLVPPSDHTPRHKRNNVVYAAQCSEECTDFLDWGDQTTKRMIQHWKASVYTKPCSCP